MAQLNEIQHLNPDVEKQLGFAAIVQKGDTLYLSGIISIDEQMNVVAPGDMTGQVERVYDIMEATLALCGATFANVVNEVVYVTDVQKFAEAAPARLKRYADCAPPATTAVQVSALFFPEAMIEIQATAVLDQARWAPQAD